MLRSGNVFMAIFLGAIILVPAPMNGASLALQAVETDIRHGPHVEQVVYAIYPYDFGAVLALEAGEIQAYANTVDCYFPPDDTSGYDTYPISFNEYQVCSFNGRHYPYNLSSFRMAFSYALDKHSAAQEMPGGIGRPHDSFVPATHTWSSEDILNPSFYSPEPILGNAILDAAGFSVNPETGWRRCPDGSELNVSVSWYNWPNRDIAVMAVDALHSLHVAAWEGLAHSVAPLCECCGHVDFDVYCATTDELFSDIDSLVDLFWSGYVDDPYDRSPCFQNATYDYWRNLYYNAESEAEGRHALEQMQIIVHDAAPVVPVCHRTRLQVVRTENYAGYVEEIGQGAVGVWTLRNIHPKNDTHGGTFSVGWSESPDSFNIFTANTTLSKHVFANIYSSLFRRGPDGTPVPDLAESLKIERHEDNANVPQGYIRYTVDVLKNVTWSDGEPLTAEDVAYTFNYIVESASYGNPSSHGLPELQSAVALNPATLRLEFSSDSYRTFDGFAYFPIIPEHVFRGDPGIEPSQWQVWDPILNSTWPLVTSGPFHLVGYTEDEHVILERNNLYHWRPDPEFTGCLRPGNEVYRAGSTEFFVDWQSSIPLLGQYECALNGGLLSTGVWNGSAISVGIGGLSAGEYEMCVNVCDSFGNLYHGSLAFEVRPAGGLIEWLQSDPLHAVALGVSVSSASVIAAVGILALRERMLRGD